MLKYLPQCLRPSPSCSTTFLFGLSSHLLMLQTWPFNFQPCFIKLNKHGVCNIVALSFILKTVLRQKKTFEDSNISPSKNIILKKSFKRNQNPSRYHNSITNLKFNTSQNIIFQKSSCTKIDLLSRGQNPLSYYTL
jgi:hypothetical protein